MAASSFSTGDNSLFTRSPRNLSRWIVLIVSAMLLAACGGSSVQATPTVPGTATPVPTTTPAPPAVDTVRIPSIGVDAPLTLRKVGADGKQQEPDGTDDVAIYDFEPAWQIYGGLPGAGNVILSGKLDSSSLPCKKGTVPAPCQAVFWNLRLATVGTTIQVFWHGQRYDYTVVSKCLLNLTSGKYDAVVAKTESETLTLVTAGGLFVNGQYDSRLVIRAERKPGTVPHECVGGSTPA